MHVEMKRVSTFTIDFVDEVDKKLWVGSGLFQNCTSFFGTQTTVFGSTSFDCIIWIALPDDAAGCSSMLNGWGQIDIMEMSHKVFGV